MNHNKILKYLLIIVSLLWYYLLYYQIVREEFFFLISGILILGGIYFYWIVFEPFTKTEILGFAILFRVVLLFGTPNFSDDFYRFIWDGKVSLSGGNPYEFTPNQIINKKLDFRVGNIKEIYSNLNSKNYFTVYPPLNQIIFAVCEFAGNGNIESSVLYMKLFILLFEIGLIFLLFKMLKKLKLKESLAQIYALNPLVIIELTGNVHFEGIMIFFFILSLWFLINHSIILSGIAIALAINVKVIPLLFLPLFFSLLGFSKSLKLYLTIAVVTTILVFPFMSETLISNFSESLNLYFQTFEFNASFYYLIKGISHYFLGYKTEVIGIAIPIIVFLFALFMTYKLHKKSKTRSYGGFDMKLFVSYAIPLIFVFYLLASTVHPWYIINLVILSVFVRRNSILIWSVLAFISYFAYSHLIPNGDFHNSNWYYFLVTIEYSIVFVLFMFEQLKNYRNET